MPRVYGDGHLATTDMPGLLLWAATTLAFWKGLYEPHAGRWRVLVGILIGLAFVEKMAAVFVLGPLFVWLVVSHLTRIFRNACWADWIDGIVTSTFLLAPLALAFAEILRYRIIYPDRSQPICSSIALRATCPAGSWPRLLSSGSRVEGWRGFFGRVRSGGLSGPRWKSGRRFSPSRRWSVGLGIPNGGAKPCPDWRITTSSTPTAAVPCPIFKLVILARLTTTVSPGTTVGCSRRSRYRQRFSSPRCWEWLHQCDGLGRIDFLSIFSSTSPPCPSRGCCRPRRTTGFA